MRKCLLAILSILCLSGCMNTLAGIAGESLGIPLTSKVVSSKMEPNLLIADDTSICEVPKGRWEEAEVGKPFLCIWSGTRR